MRVFIFFGLLSTLIEYLTIRIYHVSTQSEETFCTINIKNTKNLSEKRWKLNIQMQSFIILLEILSFELISILADVINSNSRKPVNTLDSIIYIFESNYEFVINENNHCEQFESDCRKFLSMLKLLRLELEDKRYLECRVVINLLLDLSKEIYIFSHIFNNFVHTQIVHISCHSYSTKKANKIWNIEMKRLSFLINLFSTFDKKIV